MTGRHFLPFLKPPAIVFSGLLCLLFLIAGTVDAQVQAGQSAADAISRENRLRTGSIAGNSVDTGAGAFVLAKQLLHVQGGRLLDFSMNYSSVQTASKGALGYGWSHGYEAFIEGDPQGVVTVHWDENRKNSFHYAGSTVPYLAVDDAVRYDTLIRNSNGSWRITRLDGTIYEFSSQGSLQRLGNKVFQFLNLSLNSAQQPTSIRDAISSKEIRLRYRRDGSGLLESVKDGGERVVYFNYDAGERLSAVHGPATLGPQQGPAFGSPRTIPDNSTAGLTYTITVTQTGPIGLVELPSAIVNHSRPSDLKMTLISPRGTQVILRDLIATGINNPWDLSGVVFLAFAGENPQGTWTVRFADSVPGITGSLADFSLKFTEPTNPVSYTYDAAGQLTLATDPDGQQLFANTYDDQGRIIAQDDGLDTNLIATFSYGTTPEGWLRTTYRDRAGGTQVFVHDNKYRLLSYTNALGNTKPIVHFPARLNF